MSIQLIQRYYAEVDRIIQFGGKANEAVVSQKFGDLIDGYCRKRNLMLVPQIDIKTKEGRLVRPDGTIKNVLRLDYGYWESKANVDLEEEIRKKDQRRLSSHQYPLRGQQDRDTSRVPAS
jgi:hypothetical protein